MILIIDNYDSFTYNLYQYLGELGYEPAVFRNDRITLDEIEQQRPSHLIISPGPCTPLEAGISNEVVRHFGGRIPILGVCLGHQCIGHVYGGLVTHAPVPTHGKSSPVYHDGKTIFRNLPNPFDGGRYHSLIVELTEQSNNLEESARTAEGVIMGIRHRRYNVEGIQFHPESIMTEAGHDILTNFLSVTSAVRPEEQP
jgi:anthranilate synthase/aminodeoxychorismate synthase-like glutamine amidotransferase